MKKKKILSATILVSYLFLSAGTVFGTTFDPEDPANQWPKAGDALETLTKEGFWNGETYEKDGKTIPQRVDSDAPSSSSFWGGGNGGPSDLSSTSFKFDANALSPSQNQYKGGTRANVTKILANIGKFLLVGVTTLAVLSIAIGGIMIATTGPSERAAKGKTIISLNIMAIVIALLSYSIIQIVRWMLSV